MNNIKIIVPAAGESKRFTEKGIKTPKSLIKFGWRDHPKKTMIEHALYGLDGRTSHVGVQNKLKDEFLIKLMHGNFTFHPIHNSLGQANTAYQIAMNIKDDSPVLILNTDSMFLYPLKTFLKQVKDFDAAAIVFDGDYNPIYSYIDSYPIFQNGIEKDPISPWAMAGAFYFKSKNDFIKAYEAYHAVASSEEYLSEVFNFLSGDKLAVYIPREQWICWGTAEELLSDEDVTEIEF